MIDVEEFGAIGDGIADDGAAIEAALLAAFAAHDQTTGDDDSGRGAVDADREA